MNDTQRRKIAGKTLALVILVAVVAAVTVTLIQQLLLGHSNAAVTGGVVGALTAVVVINTVRKRPS